MIRQLRLFIAVPIPAAVRNVIGHLQTELRQLIPGFRWSNPDNLHLTLRFLGDQPEECLEKLCKIMLSVGDSSSCFQLTISGIDAFPSWHRGRVLWLGVEEPEPVRQLHRKLSEGLLQVGIPEEHRRFHPHLTIGRSQRFKSLPQLPLELRHRSVEAYRVDRLVLYQSRLTPQGAVHTELSVARLNG